MARTFLPPRRWYGLLCLILAGAMLVWGQTVLETRLTGRTFIVYWTLCFLFTGLALIISLIDTYKLRRQMRREEQELYERTMEQIHEAQKNYPGAKRAGKRRSIGRSSTTRKRFRRD